MSTLEINFQPFPKQETAYNLLTDNQTTELLYGGGAGGGKSDLLCSWVILNAVRYPGSRGLLGRSVLKNLKESTLLTFFDRCSKWGVKSSVHFKFNQQENVLTFWNGSTIYLKDLFAYPSDPNFDSLGSTEFTYAGIDEANQVTHRAKEVVKSRIRYRLDEFELIPKLFMSCNPAKNWAYSEFYKPWRDGSLPAGKAFVPSLATDNPYISPHYIQSLHELKDPAMKQRLLYGNWEYDDDPLALFQADAIADLFTNQIESGEKYITCDAARLGRDKCVIMVWDGLTVIHITAYDISRLTRIESEIERLRQIYGIGRSQVIVDEDGIGCLVPGTEVLTTDGWRPVEQIEEGQRLYSRHTDGTVTTEKVLRTRTFEDQECIDVHDGYTFSRGHLVQYRTRTEHPWRLGFWDGITEKALVYLDGSFPWTGKDRNIGFRQHRAYMPRGGVRTYAAELDLPISVYAPFLAWFLAEGCMDGKYVSISQSSLSKHNQKIIDAISACGFAYTVKTSKAGENTYSIGNRSLQSWLKRHCYEAGKSHTAHYKKVPEILKLASAQTIRLFLDAYCDGDGAIHHGANEYFTSSKQMASDLHELVLKSGRMANTRVKHKVGSQGNIHGRTITRTQDAFVVYEWKSTRMTLRPSKPRRFVSKVYDLHISGPTRLYMVRGKDGRAFWVHNGGVVDHLEGIRGFTANAAPIQDDRSRGDASASGQGTYRLNYANLKAQCYYELADRVSKRKIGIRCETPEHQELITADLEQVKAKDTDKDGKLKIVSKEDMKENLGRSPDFSDSLMMRMVFDLEPEPIRFGMWVA